MSDNKKNVPDAEVVADHCVVVRCEGGGSFRASSYTSLLVAMEHSGERLIAVGCRGGGCGKCRIRIIQGEYVSKRMSRAWVSPEQAAEGAALACRVFARSDMLIKPDPPELALSRHAMASLEPQETSL